MVINRSVGRNIHFYDATSRGAALGGLIQNGSVTEANFLDIFEILLITERSVRVQERVSGHIVARTDNQLELGEYDVYCDGSITINSEPWVNRLISRNVSGREDAFRNSIRLRDGKCVISGVVNRGAIHGNWTSFEAAHIFPLEKESLWIEWNFGQWVTDMDYTNGVSKINSLQNGILLQSSVHQQFDQYLISVNPDDNYKVIVFGDDNFGLDGRVLDDACRNADDPHHVSAELLRWHF